MSMNSLESHFEKFVYGYDRETAIRYTEGHNQFFNIERIEDGAAIAMEERIHKFTEGIPIDVVVDIGCGSNVNYLKLWLSSSQAKKVIGIEPSPHMRKLLEEKMTPELAESIQILKGDWEHTSLEPSIVDLAVSRFSLHHLKNISDGYKELSRILKPGRQAIISLPHPEYCKKELEKQAKEAKEGEPMEVQVFDAKLYYFYHDIESYLGEHLVAHGLELVESESLNWGTTDPEAAKIPNTLVFTLKKRVS